MTQLQPTLGLVQVTAPHFCAGIVLDGPTVVEAAPVVHYMRGWPASRAVAYCRRKGWAWRVVVVPVQATG